MSGGNPPEIGTRDISISGYGRVTRSGRRSQEAEYAETIGFESMSLKSAGSGELTLAMEIGEIVNRSAAETQRRTRKAVVKERIEKDPQRKIFPPFLTTLNWNGRPRFSFAKESTADGRLRMRIVRSEGREIVRFVCGDGRLRMVLVGLDGEDSDDCGGLEGEEVPEREGDAGGCVDGVGGGD